MTMETAEMTSTKPYFVKAIFQWIIDNNKTPFIEVNTVLPNVSVPTQYVKNGKIILDINPSAVNNFYMGLDAISFEARFDTRVLPIFVPVYAIDAIFAAENGQGMSFPPEKMDIKSIKKNNPTSAFGKSEESLKSEEVIPQPKKEKPKLTLIE